MLNFIRNAINCGWTLDDRNTIIEEIWNEIREMAGTLLEEARLMGATLNL